MTTDKCNDNGMCVHLAKQIVPFEKAGFVKWEKVVNSKIQLCGVAYKKTSSATPFLITVCPWCGEHPGLEFPLKREVTA
jgi:uncharacterized CHY-type Zn-finger protein